MRISAYGKSDVGNVRENNEDRFLIDDELQLYIVCDGMGGHAAGEVASQNAVRIVADFIRCNRGKNYASPLAATDAEQAAALAEDAVHDASDKICEMAEREADLFGMGTTLTLLYVAADHGVVAHVGDSRIYLYRAGRIEQLSQDHTVANELAREGALDPRFVHLSTLSHMLTRSLGRTEGFVVDTLILPLQAGDRFVLCSDGLSNYFSDDDDLRAIIDNQDPATIPGRLVNFACENGGSDNITAVVVAVEADA